MSDIHLGPYNALQQLGADDSKPQAAVQELPMPRHLATREKLQQAGFEITNPYK